MGVSVFPEFELGWRRESFLNVGGTISRWGGEVLVVGDGNVGVCPHRMKVKGRTCELKCSLSPSLHPGWESPCCVTACSRDGLKERPEDLKQDTFSA